MQLHPRVTSAAVALVKRFEGFRAKAARLPNGGWTVGYGHTRAAREGAEVSETDAEALLMFDLSEVARAIEPLILAPVNANQFDALTAFAFNIGVENFKGSTVLKRLNEGAYLEAAAALELWRRAAFDGEDVVVDALVRRRAAEKALFLTPPEGFAPAPSPVVRPEFDNSVVAAAKAWAEAHEKAVIVTAPLEGPAATVGLQIPPGREGDLAPTPASAIADVAARQAALKLAEPLPEPAHAAHPAEAAPPPPPVVVPFMVSPPAQPPEPVLVPEEPEAHAPPAAPPFARDAGFELPPPPAPVAWSPPPPPQRPSYYAPPLLSQPEVHEPEPSLFDAPEPYSHEPYEPEAHTPPAPWIDHGAPEAEPARKRSLFDRPEPFYVLAIAGVALFAFAIVSLFRQANLLNLALGLVGVVMMAPAAAFFLVRALSAAAPAEPVDETAFGEHPAGFHPGPDAHADWPPAE
jgi:lysozyme